MFDSQNYLQLDEAFIAEKGEVQTQIYDDSIGLSRLREGMYQSFGDRSWDWERRWENFQVSEVHC